MELGAEEEDLTDQIQQKIYENKVDLQKENLRLREEIDQISLDF